MKHQCTRCGHTARTGALFDAHECRHTDGTPMRNLSELPPAILRALATKSITEPEAWDLARKLDARIAYLENHEPESEAEKWAQCDEYAELTTLRDLEQTVDNAIDAAVAVIQAALGQTDGGFAAHYLAGDRLNAPREILFNYGEAESRHLAMEQRKCK